MASPPADIPRLVSELLHICRQPAHIRCIAFSTFLSIQSFYLSWHSQMYQLYNTNKFMQSSSRSGVESRTRSGGRILKQAYNIVSQQHSISPRRSFSFLPVFIEGICDWMLNNCIFYYRFHYKNGNENNKKFIYFFILSSCQVSRMQNMWFSLLFFEIKIIIIKNNNKLINNSLSTYKMS